MTGLADGDALVPGRRVLRDLAIDFDRLTPLAGGARNVVLSVDDRFVLRMSRDAEAGLLLDEAEILRQLGTHPRFPIVLHAGVADGWTYQVQRFVPGTSPIALWPSLTPRQRRALVERLCDALRIMHASTRDGFGRHGEPPCLSGWRDYCARELAALTGRAEALGALPALVTESRRFFGSHARVLGTGRRGCLVHNDLWFGNLLVDGGELRAVLDFELAFWGEPDLDLFKLEYFCRDPEAYGFGGDFADAMPMIARAYPELFVPDLAERLDLYDLLFTWRYLLYGLDRGGDEAKAATDYALPHLDELLGRGIRRMV